MATIDTTALYEDVSTLDRPAVEALATEAFILAVQHIMEKLGVKDGDLAAHMLPDGNPAERLLCDYIEAEIDRKLEAEEQAEDLEDRIALSRTTTIKDRP